MCASGKCEWEESNGIKAYEANKSLDKNKANISVEIAMSCTDLHQAPTNGNIPKSPR